MKKFTVVVLLITSFVLSADPYRTHLGKLNAPLPELKGNMPNKTFLTVDNYRGYDIVAFTTKNGKVETIRGSYIIRDSDKMLKVVKEEMTFLRDTYGVKNNSSDKKGTFIIYDDDKIIVAIIVNRIKGVYTVNTTMCVKE
jgi:hypothetical protein